MAAIVYFVVASGRKIWVKNIGDKIDLTAQIQYRFRQIYQQNDPCITKIAFV